MLVFNTKRLAKKPKVNAKDKVGGTSAESSQ